MAPKLLTSVSLQSHTHSTAPGVRSQPSHLLPFLLEVLFTRGSVLLPEPHTAPGLPLRTAAPVYPPTQARLCSAINPASLRISFPCFTSFKKKKSKHTFHSITALPFLNCSSPQVLLIVLNAVPSAVDCMEFDHGGCLLFNKGLGLLNRGKFHSHEQDSAFWSPWLLSHSR